jgi:hypothetical protein
LGAREQQAVLAPAQGLSWQSGSWQSVKPSQSLSSPSPQEVSTPGCVTVHVQVPPSQTDVPMHGGCVPHSH